MVSFQRIIEKFPSITPRDENKNIVKFTDSFSDELDEFGENIEQVQDSRFIDKASGKELDQIGEQYGILGNRDNRSDEEYSQFLKSLVPAFRFKGTVPGIRAAVGAGLNINDGLNSGTQEIFVKEHFEDNPNTSEKHLEYTLIFDNWTQHPGTTVEELAQLSDSSMSKLRKSQYNIEEETTILSDNINIQEPIITPDTTVSNDIITTDVNTVIWDTGEWDTMHFGKNDHIDKTNKSLWSNKTWNNENWT